LAETCGGEPGGSRTHNLDKPEPIVARNKAFFSCFPGGGVGFINPFMPRSHWLVKQEPEDYSWDSFVKEKKVAWTGVRSFPARKHLRTMSKDDFVLFYHSGDGKEVVGVAKVTREAYADPTATEGDWSSVDLAPVKALARPVGLARIKVDAVLKDILLVRQSRLSVLPLTEAQFLRILDMSETAL
jgi:predicted RNA-binding protein with PUA-like domain